MNDSPSVIDGDEIVIGGGSINEKRRSNNTLTGTSNKDDTDNLKNVEGEPEVDVNVGKGNYFDPENIPSHLFHAMMGLDRYPNYLSRVCDYYLYLPP